MWEQRYLADLNVQRMLVWTWPQTCSLLLCAWNELIELCKTSDHRFASLNQCGLSGGFCLNPIGQTFLIPLGTEQSAARNRAFRNSPKLPELVTAFIQQEKGWKVKRKLKYTSLQNKEKVENNKITKKVKAKLRIHKWKRGQLKFWGSLTKIYGKWAPFQSLLQFVSKSKDEKEG